MTATSSDNRLARSTMRPVSNDTSSTKEIEVKDKIQAREELIICFRFLPLNLILSLL